MKHFIKYLLSALVFIVGCGEDEYVTPDIGLRYFPLVTGYNWTYKVHETLYTELNEPQDLDYHIKVLVADSSANTDGSYTYVLYRFKRENETAPWTSLDTWSARKNEHDLVVTEGGVSYRKLLFPLREGNVWNGNVYNNKPVDEYLLTEVGVPAQLEGMTFEHAVTVTQEDNQDFIVFLDERHEVYAENVGMIYKETTQLEYCTEENCVGQQQVKSGRKLKQELIAYEVD